MKDMKVKIRRVDAGDAGFELYDSGSGKVLETGITLGRVYSYIMSAKVSELAKVAEIIDRFVTKAELEFRRTQGADSGGDPKFYKAIQEDLALATPEESGSTLTFEEVSKGGENKSPG